MISVAVLLLGFVSVALESVAVFVTVPTAAGATLNLKYTKSLLVKGPSVEQVTVWPVCEQEYAPAGRVCP